MPRIDPPIAETQGAAASRPERAAASAIDWRQLSHELRTPLNAILGNVELLLDGSAGPLSTEARMCIGEVQVAGRQLLHQVRVLLAWSELSASAPVLERHHPLDVIALIREISTTGCPNPLRIEPDDAHFLVSGNPFWLRMLLGEIVALPGAPAATATVRLERHAGSTTLGFFWSGFCADRTGTLRLALIEDIARLQGASVTPHPDGLILYWPVEQLVPAATATPARQRIGRSPRRRTVLG